MPPPACALRIGKDHVAYDLRRVLEIMPTRGFFLNLEHYLALRFVIPPHSGWIPAVSRLHTREEHGGGQEHCRELECIRLIGHDILPLGPAGSSGLGGSK